MMSAFFAQGGRSQGVVNLAAEIVEHIERVDRLVHENTAAFGGKTASPRAFGVICARTVPGHERTRTQKGAKLTGIDDGFGGEIGRNHAVLEGNADVPAGLFSTFKISRPSS